jgi:hypothetical protein
MILKPTKHTNPSLSVLNGAALMLKAIRKKRIMSYEEMNMHLEKNLGKEFVSDFSVYAGFLYILGKISYSEKNDSFIYVETSVK